MTGRGGESERSVWWEALMAASTLCEDSAKVHILRSNMPFVLPLGSVLSAKSPESMGTSA